MKEKLKLWWSYWTVRFGIALTVAPDVLATIRDNFTSLAPYIPQLYQPRLLNLIGLLITLLRIRRSAQPQ